MFLGELTSTAGQVSLSGRLILLVSYADESRMVMVDTLRKYGVVPVPCASFCEAEDLATQGLYSGLVIDLASSVKAKGEEKIVSCSLGNTYPTIRVRVVGAMLVPMTLSGAGSQDKSLDVFLNKTCMVAPARKLRRHKRHLYSTPVVLCPPASAKNNCHWMKSEKCGGKDHRGNTYDLSWGGAYILTSTSEEFRPGDEITVDMFHMKVRISAAVCRVQLWGIHGVLPGIGVRWHTPLDPEVYRALKKVLRTSHDHDKDRLVA